MISNDELKEDSKDHYEPGVTGRNPHALVGSLGKYLLKKPPKSPAARSSNPWNRFFLWALHLKASPSSASVSSHLKVRERQGCLGTF